MTHPKVQKMHLERKAVIYIRRSSLHQMEEHSEGQRRQYQLVELAQSLGWPAEQCEIIDDDPAISASQSYNRPGYQRLVSLVALHEVGLIVGLEVGRLARNCLDWYQLLQIAAVFEVLVADEDGVYDLNDFNDRLVLGDKAYISQWVAEQLRTFNQSHRTADAASGQSETTSLGSFSPSVQQRSTNH